MNTTPIPNPMKSTRMMRLLGLSALAVAVAALAQHAARELARAETEVSAPASVARFRLEQREGKFFRAGTTASFSGWVTDHFASGAVKLRSAVQDGRLHGESTGWFTNGVIELREQFQRGLPHGLRMTWHASGQQRSEGRLIAGQQEGTYRLWHENGKLAVEAQFAAGKPHGPSRAWYPSGCLKAEAMMQQGEGLARHVYPDGTQQEPTLVAANQTR